MTARSSSMRRFTKRYPTTQSCRAAAANYRWLVDLGTPLRLPRVLGTRARRIEFEFVAGRHARPGDLRALAAHLGDVHGAAFVAALHRARLDRPLLTASGHLIPDFLSRRTVALLERLHAHAVPLPLLDTERASALLHDASGGPAAIYKDCNPRNFLITPTGPVAVDFDQVTLAPFGYDLAKLVVTLAMTHGSIVRNTVAAAVRAYNTAANNHRRGLCEMDLAQLRDWAEIHHILTSGYLGTRGYQHGWHTVRAALDESHTDRKETQ